jgi:hypothetical protein
MEFPISNDRLSFASAQDFKKIPGAPIAYWLTDNVRNAFSLGNSLGSIGHVRQGLHTADNARFLRLWHEVQYHQIGFSIDSRDKAKATHKKWFPHNKGGTFRKWYGNQTYLVCWENDGEEIRNFRWDDGKTRSSTGSMEFYFRESGSWSSVTSGKFCIRFFPAGFVFDAAGHSIFIGDQTILLSLIGVLNSPVMGATVSAVSPTINYEVGQISNFPVSQAVADGLGYHNVQKLISISKADWDFFETSWNFTSSPLINHKQEVKQRHLQCCYEKMRAQGEELTLVSMKLEQENNLVFIKDYGLENEVTPDVPLEEITLTCNPHYRYKGNYTDEEREVRLLQDTMKEFLSYAVGCMFGRYSLDKPGLILANQGETLQDYLRIIAKEPIFTPTENNVIPILDGDWFADDVTARFKQLLKITFGEPNYEENLRFIEGALGKDLRKYFLKDFYKDHVQTYKKRPIYWLFSSPRGSFNALIYMHRYQPNTVSVVLNQYLREYREKLNAQRRYQESLSISPSSSQREKTTALKEIENLSKILAELKTYEDEVLFPLAGEQIEIDLDDGVVVNYAKFSEALRKI